MGRASQEHKLDIRGYNSLGQRKALAKVLSNAGTDAVEAVIEVNGLWSSTDTFRVVTNLGAGNVTINYTPGGDQDAETAATGLAQAINVEADHTASATSNVVRITKTTAGTLTIVSTEFV
jgi:hypothetical protein